jgi:tight adherence protein B
MNGPLLFGGLIGLAALMGFVALWRMTGTRDPVEARLQQYDPGTELPANAMEAEVRAGLQRPSSEKLNRLLGRSGFGHRLAKDLTRADSPLTVGEFVLIMLGLASLGFLVGILRMGPLLGIPAGAILGYAPVIYIRSAGKRRQHAFTEQLPDVLTLLVSALQAGYGLGQSLQVLVEQLPPPASVEFARVIRAVSLGLPFPRALAAMAERVGTDDVGLLVTAITIQYETGGNLAQTLEVIGQTVRDRIRIQREIRVLTSQQRLTGLILGGLPVVLAIGLFFINPQHMGKLFEPGLMRIMLVGAVVMQVTGYLIVNKLLNVEV